MKYGNDVFYFIELKSVRTAVGEKTGWESARGGKPTRKLEEFGKRQTKVSGKF